MTAGESRPGSALDARAKAPLVWTALLAVALICWTVVARDAIAMGNGPGTAGRGVAAFIVVWMTMMTAMMLPAVAPFASLYLRCVSGSQSAPRRTLRVASVIVGYLGVWTGFGIVAFAAASAGGRLAAEAPGAAPWVGAAVLAAAGLYQLTPLKERCLSHCRSPLGLLLHFGGYSGRLRDVRVGVYHGGYCVGCCWSLFLVLVAVGVMNLVWMGALAAVIFLEKTWRFGKPLGVAFGIALLVLAFSVPAYPELVPGLHLDGGVGMHTER